MDYIRHVGKDWKIIMTKIEVCISHMRQNSLDYWPAQYSDHLYLWRRLRRDIVTVIEDHLEHYYD